MSVTPITSLSEFRTAINSGKVIIIDFWATWCGPCRVISPVFEQLSKQHTQDGAVEFYKVDVDAVPDVAQEVNIRAMPTFVAFKDGVKVNELVGADPKKLTNLVQSGASLV